MESHNLHQRTSAGVRHSMDVEHHGTLNGASTSGGGHPSEHEFHPVQSHLPTLPTLRVHAVGVSPRHNAHNHTSSPRRRAANLKAKSSDANLVQLSQESSRDSRNGRGRDVWDPRDPRDPRDLRGQLRRLSRSLGVARIVALLAGLVVLGLVLSRPLRAVKHHLSCAAFKSKKKALADDLGFMTPYEPYSRAFAAMHHAEPSTSSVRHGQYMCARAMEFEQIGLLFLTHERIRNEEAWARWFDGAKGKIPLGRGRLGRCAHSGSSIQDFEDVASVCGVKTETDAADPISNQFLFDVWVHLKQGEDRAIFDGSIFESRLVPDESRIAATWGGHSLIDATRVLLAASLANPLVSKMILVSDSDLPLYGPAMIYNQIMNEEKSRVNACNTTAGWDRNEYRLRYDFIERGISWATWRKSWQWVALNRSHASLVIRDTEVDGIFRTLCRPRWDHDWCDFRVCYSDEHYIPTLLAVHGLDNETDCVGELTDKDWSRVKATDAHPWEYQAKEVNEALFTRLRHPEVDGCERSMLIQSGLSGLFTTSETLMSKASRSDAAKASQGEPVDICKLVRETTYNRVPSFVPLGPRCPLLARKFAADTTDAVEVITGWIFGEEWW